MHHHGSAPCSAGDSGCSGVGAAMAAPATSDVGAATMCVAPHEMFITANRPLLWHCGAMAGKHSPQLGVSRTDGCSELPDPSHSNCAITISSSFQVQFACSSEQASCGSRQALSTQKHITHSTGSADLAVRVRQNNADLCAPFRQQERPQRWPRQPGWQPGDNRSLPGFAPAGGQAGRGRCGHRSRGVMPVRSRSSSRAGGGAVC